ncbi:hypothetical protein [Terrihabitans sp. B22-R8]|uniref:hypothetical protein n=1 Tax=Terrihabitans sp. B22-R8 TaxID=3425128 RepID=UPI00403CE8A3
MPTELPDNVPDSDPDTLFLPPSRPRWILTLVACLLILALDVALIIAQNQSIMWILVVLFGAMAAFAASQLVPGMGGLSLDREGFSFRLAFFTRRRRWDEITPIASSNAGLFQLVGYHLKDEPKTKPREVLPETYGVGAHELGRVMNWWRERALSGTSAERVPSGLVDAGVEDAGA